ncbi:MAG TPA: 3-phosphoshikimate 1-carboxyvinyltransferase [Thermoanaerobaculia bacterium]
MKRIPKIDRAQGRIAAPPSKSYTNRAILLAAMAEGETTIANALDSDDSRFMLEAIRKIGFDVRGSLTNEVTIGERVGISANEVRLYVGNAGTAMRFLTAFLSFVPGRFILEGDSRMHQRPIGDLVDALRGIGGEIEYLGQEGFPPISVRGKRMRGGFEVAISGETSSQFVSALMMAGTTLTDGMTLRVHSLASRPYLEITKDILRQFGAAVEEVEPNVYSVRGGPLQCDRYEVEGDFSSASYWFAAAAPTRGEVTVTKVKLGSAQGDRMFIEVLERMGCRAEWSETAVTMRGPVRLRGGMFDCNEIPDIVPTLAAIAPLAETPVEIVNVAHLRVKESDRISAVADELRKLGVRVDEKDDGMVIHPGWNDGSATIDPHGDHRIAMSFAIAGLLRGNVEIADEQVVSKSYPRFWRDLEELVRQSG